MQTPCADTPQTRIASEYAGDAQDDMVWMFRNVSLCSLHILYIKTDTGGYNFRYGGMGETCKTY